MITAKQLLSSKYGGVISHEEVTDEIQKIRYTAKNQKQLAKWEVKHKCNYCKKTYRYNLLIGDGNHGACFNPRCILASMRDHL